MLLHEPGKEDGGTFLGRGVYIDDHQTRLESRLAVGKGGVLLLKFFDVFSTQEELKVKLCHMLRKRGAVVEAAGQQSNPMLSQTPALLNCERTDTSSWSKALDKVPNFALCRSLKQKRLRATLCVRCQQIQPVCTAHYIFTTLPQHHSPVLVPAGAGYRSRVQCIAAK